MTKMYLYNKYKLIGMLLLLSRKVEATAFSIVEIKNYFLYFRKIFFFNQVLEICLLKMLFPLLPLLMFLVYDFSLPVI